MTKCKNKRGSILLVTLFIMMILILLGLAMLPLSVMEYKISHHFSNFEKAYYIAEAGLEEAIAELNVNWDYQGKSDQSFFDGVYAIDVRGTENVRTVVVSGKIGSIQRTLEAEIERPVCNLSEWKKFALFSQASLEIGELGNINGGITGSRGDLSYCKFDTEEVQTSLFIQGSVLEKKTVLTEEQLASRNIYLMDSEDLMDVSTFNMDLYISWLKENYGAMITEENNIFHSDKSFKMIQREPEDCTQEAPILIIQNYQDVTLSGHFNGLIIVNKANEIRIENESIINGMILVGGNEIETTKLYIQGNEVTINGSFLSTNSTIQDVNAKLKINYNKDIVEYVNNYLPANFQMQNDKNRAINVSHWREID